MRSLIIIFTMGLAATFALGCGSTPKKPLTPAEAIAAHKAPWDKLPQAERAAYANCGEATTAMTAVSTVWNLASPAEMGGSNPQDVGEGQFVALRISPDGSGDAALIQYRMEGTKIINEIAVVVNDAGEQIILDYHVKRNLDTGAVKGDEGMDVVFAPATGEFFCFYP